MIELPNPTSNMIQLANAHPYDGLANWRQDLLPYSAYEIEVDFRVGNPANAMLMQIANMEYFHSPGWTSLSRPIQVMTKKALLDLTDIWGSTLYKKNNLPRVRLLVDASNELLDYYKILIQQAYVESDTFPPSHWVYMAEDTQVLSYLYDGLHEYRGIELHLDDQAIARISADERARFSPFAENTYISKGVDPVKAAQVITQYQRSFNDFIDTLSGFRQFWQNYYEHGLQKARHHLKWQDIPAFLAMGGMSETQPAYDAMLVKYVLETSMMWGNVILLDQVDYETMFSHHIRDLNRNFWVLDATLADTLVITPTGIEELTKDILKLRSNAEHEFNHKFFERLIGTYIFGGSTFSFNFWAPKWLCEGSANTFLLPQRGRHEDGFRTKQWELVQQKGIPSARDITKGSGHNYIYYSLLTYFVFCAAHAGITGQSQITLVDRKQQLVKFISVWSRLQRILQTMEIPAEGPDIPNQFAESLFTQLFEGDVSGPLEGMPFDSILDLFDKHKNDIAHAYFYPNDTCQITL